MAAEFLPNYVKSFRLQGPRIFWSVHKRKRVNGPFSVRVGQEHYWLRNSVSDRSIFFQIVVQREYETGHWPALHDRLTQSYERIIKDGRRPVIIDAGANIGFSARWFAARYPQAKIYAIEPDNDNLEMLRRNTAGCPNIAVIAGALWNEKMASLHIGNRNAGSAGFRASEGDGGIIPYTVPEIVGSDPLLITKIDIEGGEAALFRNNTGWLDETKLTILELHDWLYPGEGTSRTFLKEIAKRNVDVVHRGENLFVFANDHVQ